VTVPRQPGLEHDMARQAFPGFDKLHYLHDVTHSRHMRGSGTPYLRNGREITRGEAPPPARYLLKWAMGGARPSDFILPCAVAPIVVSGRVVSLLEEHACTGWGSYPVSVVDKNGKRCKGYRGLIVRGRCGPVDLNMSEVVLEELPVGWLPSFRGHLFDPGSWDGSDIFMHRQPGSCVVMVSDRVRAAFKKAKVKNVRLEALDGMCTSSIVYSQRPDIMPDDFWKRVDRAYRKAGVPKPALLKERRKSYRKRLREA